MSASTSDVLSAIKNIVTALNASTDTLLSINGKLNFPATGAATVVKATPGRLARLSVTVAGTAPGTIYDGATLTAKTKPLGIIPNTVGIFTVNLPLSFGLLVVPGTGQMVAGSYS